MSKFELDPINAEGNFGKNKSSKTVDEEEEENSNDDDDIEILDEIPADSELKFWKKKHFRRTKHIFWHFQKYKNTFFAISKMGKNPVLHQKKFKTMQNAIFGLKKKTGFFN